MHRMEEYFQHGQTTAEFSNAVAVIDKFDGWNLEGWAMNERRAGSQRDWGEVGGMQVDPHQGSYMQR